MFTIKHLLNNNLIRNNYILGIFKSVGSQSIYTSKVLSQTSDVPPPPPNYVLKGKKKDPPSDFLPFPWIRKTKNNIFEESGDYEKCLEVDPTSPKPDFEYSEELKTANETVKHFFSVATAAYPERREVCRRQTIKRVQRHPLDFDSLEVKIAEHTVRVRNLYEHAERAHRSDRRNRRLLLPIMIQKRNSLLRRLWFLDQDRFEWILKELKLHLLYIPIGRQYFKYSRKNDMRRMTKTYCEKMIADKRAAYHETLKKEQELFEEEKAEALAWIAEEEKVIKALDAMLENH